MIEIVFKNENDRIKGFFVTGHANTAPHGHDIVCAGVSALAQTAVLGLEEHLKKKISYKAEAGDLFLNIEENPDDLTDAVLKTMKLGLTEIEKLYPKTVKIKKG
jgi:uncharacterized protein YsxB (DUF464 family)